MNFLLYAVGGGAALAAILAFALFTGEIGGGVAPAVLMNSTPDQSRADHAVADSDRVTVTEDVKHTIPLEKIRSGGPPKDGIPSIDRPRFTDADSATVSDSEVVVGLEIGEEARAYPLSILVWHEIVNDEVGGVPVAITYCPLCYTTQVFERVIDGEAVEFGVSGKLYNSNLLMYDRLTDSYWSQALGEAVVGELAGEQLGIVPFDVIAWGDWKSIRPDTKVLTTETGHARPYGVDPYQNYFATDGIMFPVDHTDDRLSTKEIILGFKSEGRYKAYLQSDVASSTLINDLFADDPILLVSLYSQNARAFDRTVGDRVLEFAYEDGALTDTATGSMWSYDGVAISGPLKGSQLQRLGFSPGFWFEWVAFYPDTDLYGNEL